nr:2-amino-4-hydroxy-6-hydroxymethyldihydropteridine diphosphokinase [Aliikangiella sp. G2MR2-5]
MQIAYIGLGANLNEPQKQIEKALLAIGSLEKIVLQVCSSLYRSSPMGPQDQDDYINAVCRIHTTLTPEELLNELQQIELSQGRVRKDERWGPRTLDLDILLYASEQINTPRLTIPHYGIKQRNFVLIPLCEIEPELIFPDGKHIHELLESVGHQGIEKL